MDYGSSLKPRKIDKGFVFVLREHNMAGQSEHFKQLDCLIVDFRKDNPRAALFSNVDDAEENRDPNTINQLGVAKVDDKRTATAVQLPATLTLYFFTG
jgi:hypothetical protein